MFDFEGIFMCPKGETSTIFYSRWLNCLNFTIFDVAEKKGTCYFWTEDQGGKSPEEVGTCLKDYLDEKAKEGYTMMQRDPQIGAVYGLQHFLISSIPPDCLKSIIYFLSQVIHRMREIRYTLRLKELAEITQYHLQLSGLASSKGLWL